MIVKKLRGENENLIRVENPGITPVKINREAQSEFLTEILHEKSSEITPKFIDYKNMIEETQIGDKKISFVKNKYNHIAQLHLIYKIGTDHDKELFLAVQVLQYLGTSRFSADQLSQEFFKLGIRFMHLFGVSKTINAQTIHTSLNQFNYSSDKIRKQLDYTFQPIQAVIQETAQKYQSK